MRQHGMVRQLGLGLWLAMALLGCQRAGTVAYLAHVTAGQARILLHQESLADLDRSRMSPGERANLALLEDVRSFARGVGLQIEGQYTRFYASDASWAVWVLTASPPTAPVLHTWEFPIAGRVPYLGFFDRGRAEQFRDRYRAEGYHTALRTASAYSTLGWFDDPLFRAQLDASRPSFAATLLHELVHATVYQPGASDWNESVASFTEDKLLELYQLQRAAFTAGELEEKSAREADAREMRAAVAQARGAIEDLYRRSPGRYPHDVTAVIDTWRAALPTRPWRRLHGERLAQRPWPVPALLGMGLYATETGYLDAAWQRLSQGHTSPDVMRRWLVWLQRCADERRDYSCLQDVRP